MPSFRTQFAGRRRAWRRAVNLRRANLPAWPAFARRLALPALLMLLAVAGGWLIASHARRLGGTTTAAGAEAQRAAAILQSIVPGAALTVPEQGVQMLAQPAGALAIAAGMRAAPPVRLDLCRQLRDPGRAGMLVPLRLGYRADDVRRWADGAAPALRNVVLVGGDATPLLRLSGRATADFDGEPLRVAWQHGTPVRWLAGADGPREGARGEGTLARQGWLAWQGGALHVERRASTACPAAGELVLRPYTPAGRAGRATVTAFGANGTATVALAAGDYRIPAASPPALEDAALFEALQGAGLLRLSRRGAIALAPADLPAWAAASPSERAAALPEWADVRIDDAARKLLRRLYRQADGAYLRRQVELYNSERSLLAWRLADGQQASPQAAGVAGPLTVTPAMPPTAVRLFDALPQGWQPWKRIARWPAGDQAVRLSFAAPRDGRIDLLLAGRITSVSGATADTASACTGRACTARDDVVRVTLQAQPGAKSVVLAVTPLPAAAMERPGDRRYRHLRVVAGRVLWQPLGQGTVSSPAPVGAPVTLTDRNGTPLWADDAPTPAATRAGLGTLVGLNPAHDSGVAAVLRRAGTGTAARLTVDLPLQALARDVLACVGMRRGAWDGRRCAGGTAPPMGREAGLVLLDSENGDILAATGFGATRAEGADWAEVRDFDRANPARSPLRLPALQHDGGARRSPGSTFKIVSALGLEMAARSDLRLDALLAGVPLARLDTVAHERGFDFASAAATYPAAADGPHVTNYRELGLERRAQDGKLGLAQALTYSLNTWFAWTGELSDATLFGRADGGVPDAQALQPGHWTVPGPSWRRRAGSVSNSRCAWTAACCRRTSTGANTTRCRPRRPASIRSAAGTSCAR
ncbi:hypothetical protein [Pseudoduganella plicata]|uniref:hypothetical protein n=1 Tax=Pseudoduganella plicata TaxID=321984 RepID=UPI001E4BF3A6|nr:hypothetical protein [Pseudoduganella plicata]